MPLMTRPSLAFAVVDGVILIAHGTGPPDDETWDQLVSVSVETYRTTQFGRALDSLGRLRGGHWKFVVLYQSSGKRTNAT